MPINSFSQETPMQRRDDQDYLRMNYSGSYEMRGRSSQYPHFGSDPYPNPPPPNFPADRQSRTLNRSNGRMMQEDYSPGPMIRHPPPGPGPGPGPYWDNYPPGHHSHLHGPPPPPGGPHHHGHPPPRGHPVPHDMPPFHHMGGGFRSTTPDIPSSSSSLSSMSPAPSPHPTPPTTPPPPHHPQMMAMGPSPMRMPHQGMPQRGPHPIGQGHRPVMPPREYQEFHMQHPGPPQIQRGPPPGGHLSGGGPHHGHSNHMGPPPYLHHSQQLHHGRMPMSGPPEWEWKRHP